MNASSNTKRDPASRVFTSRIVSSLSRASSTTDSNSAVGKPTKPPNPALRLSNPSRNDVASSLGMCRSVSVFVSEPPTADPARTGGSNGRARPASSSQREGTGALIRDILALGVRVSRRRSAHSCRCFLVRPLTCAALARGVPPVLPVVPPADARADEDEEGEELLQEEEAAAILSLRQHRIR